MSCFAPKLNEGAGASLAAACPNRGLGASCDDPRLEGGFGVDAVEPNSDDAWGADAAVFEPKRGLGSALGLSDAVAAPNMGFADSDPLGSAPNRGFAAPKTGLESDCPGTVKEGLDSWPGTAPNMGWGAFWAGAADGVASVVFDSLLASGVDPLVLAPKRLEVVEPAPEVPNLGVEPAPVSAGLESKLKSFGAALLVVKSWPVAEDLAAAEADPNKELEVDGAAANLMGESTDHVWLPPSGCCGLTGLGAFSLSDAGLVVAGEATALVLDEKMRLGFPSSPFVTRSKRLGPD